MIRLRGIEKQFGGQRVLKGIDLAMVAGSVTALIGPSGSGKSTLLRCVNVLERPDAGHLVLGGGRTRFFSPSASPERAGIAPADRHGVPEFPAVPAYDGAGKRY